MDLSLLFVLGIFGPIFILLAIIVTKMFAMKALPDSRYTPFDQATGQTNIEFHEQKEEKEEDNDQGDDKDKRKRAAGTGTPTDTD
ncbi:DUF3951 domain-containing protein [Paenibacillus sp. MBLB4367]|uniref:DUF3951 domain-containing protein n=1 Tax=Paenibacillus sp. MBLB4367 TaxID=3384767 RepID=UPI00390840CE